MTLPPQPPPAPPPPGARLPSIPHQAFWFLRHGETDWNAQGLSQGRTNVPLNARGQAQAQAAAALLGGRGIASVVSSPLGRAMDTANAAAAALGLRVSVDDDLAEVCFGEQEGQPMGDWYDSWIAGGYTPRDAESFDALQERAATALGRALSHPRPVLVVAHGALFRAVRALMRLPINVRTPNALPIWCEPPDAPDGSWRLTAAGGEVV